MPFTPPPPTEYNVLSLGAGVQSSALALMAAHGEITPTPDFAVFADVGAEPTEVYEWLETLKELIAAAPHPFPIYTVKKENGDLTKDQLSVTTSSGKGAKPKGETYIRKIIPMFGITPDGEKRGAIGRACTQDYKILPIRKYIRHACNIPRGTKTPMVTMWIGISWDEAQRAKESRVDWCQHRWPMLENRMLRSDCINWMYDHGYPVPPRSACYYCPFHSNTEWRRMRDEDPEHFQKAVKFDAELRKQVKTHDRFTRMEVYLHNSCKPLDQIDFDNDEDRGQQVWDFQSECEGMCGV
tara:strand:+ start:65 stop:955 length:891 start_codon:yes stop_codon:yes gene_type:complete